LGLLLLLFHVDGRVCCVSLIFDFVFNPEMIVQVVYMYSVIRVPVLYNFAYRDGSHVMGKVIVRWDKKRCE